MSIDLSSFHGPFFDESDEAVDTIESTCLAIDIDHIDPEAIPAMFRAIHTIKGGSATFGFSQVAEFSHSIESKLDELRSGKQNLDLQTIDVLLNSVDGLKAMLVAAKHGETLPLGEYAGYRRLLNPDPPVPTADVADSVISELSPSSPAEAGDSVKIGCPGATSTDDMSKERAEPHSHESEVGQSEPSIACFQSESKHELKRNAAAKAVGPHIGQFPKHGRQSKSKTVRVDFEKIDFLIDMLGEMVITQSTLRMHCENEKIKDFKQFQQGLLQLQQQTRLLQDGMMQIRMLPMAFCFDRLPRMVRDLSGKLGKQVELIVNGKNTELDKAIIEQLTDPLLHLLRNSIDHGIETPADRIRQGKNEVGCIRLNAFHRAGHIIIELEDDGKGIDPVLIIARARERKLLLSSENLTDAQALELIFLPGFSTLNKANELSGRGVGMDVVKKSIEALGGVIKINSDVGKRTAFKIKLPLTLAIIEGQLVAAEDERYVVPVINIVESIKSDDAQVKYAPDSGEVIQWVDRGLPVLRLTEFLGIARPGPQRKLSEGIVVIVENDGQQFGLFVDDLLEQQAIVIKSLHENYQPIAGISGATVLGNGRVALILDVNELSRIAAKRQRGYARAG